VQATQLIGMGMMHTATLMREAHLNLKSGGRDGWLLVPKKKKCAANPVSHFDTVRMIHLSDE